MNIGNITSDNFNLDGNGKDMQIEVYEQLIYHLQKKAELGEHYKNLYSSVKKQKDDVVNLLKIKISRFHNEEDYYLTTEDFEDLLRMLGEIDD